MEPPNHGGTAGAPARHVTPGQIEAFYIAEYPKLVKVLRVIDATLAEAEAAAQEAMADFIKRSRTAKAPIRSPAAYVRRAAIRFFVKERQRDRERLPREVKGGHLTLPTYLDQGLQVCEDEQWAKYVLESLTPTQRDVVNLVMDGASTREIAAQLGKKEETIRQHLKNGRDRLLVHPEIAPRVPRGLRARNPGPTE
jgi:RNA polymerase sigma factor (sigma-70 family)